MTKILFAAVLILAGLTPLAHADHERRSRPGLSSLFVSAHASCGCPVYTKRVCRGYDRHQRPLFDYFRQPFTCGCKDHDKRYKKELKAREKYLKERDKHFKKYHKRSKGKKSKK